MQNFLLLLVDKAFLEDNLFILTGLIEPVEKNSYFLLIKHLLSVLSKSVFYTTCG